MLDPAARRFLDQSAQPDAKPFHQLTPDQARRQMMATAETLDEGPEQLEVKNLRAVGRSGEIPIRIYRPNATAMAITMFFHGGGWVIGSIATHDAYCRHLAVSSGTTVISVEYRLSPEHRFPAAIHDSYDATVWVAENAATLGVESPIFNVAGDSAGGNLAAAVCLLSRDENGPAISRQALIYPITDCDLQRDSYHRYGEGYHLTRASMAWFWDNYLSHPCEGELALASPLRSRLDGLPPAFVLTAEYDPLRDEGEAYAHRLVDAGGVVTVHRSPGMIHGFIRRFDLFHQAQTALDMIGKFLAE